MRDNGTSRESVSSHPLRPQGQTPRCHKAPEWPHRHQHFLRIMAGRRDRDAMDENKQLRVVDKLRARGVNAPTEKAGVYEFGVRVRVPGGRQAIWDSDGAAGLEAQVMRD